MAAGISIENAHLRVVVSPGYGARVVSLVDRASGRDWMTQGGESTDIGEHARYRGAEAVGWDECFPTVGAWDATETPWRRRLRDHGDLWGRPWRVEAAAADALSLSFTSPDCRFTREMLLVERQLVLRYAVTSTSREPLPYLWALHALFAVSPDDRIELPGVETVRATFMALGGETLPPGPLAWSGPNGVLPFPLDRVQPRETGFAGKFIASGMPGGSARIGHPGQWLDIVWDASIADLGIWFTYGGWPEDGSHQEVAVEPTSSPANDLGEAIAAGAVPLAPGERREWVVTMSVGA